MHHDPLPPIEQLPEWHLLIGEDVHATPDAAAQADIETEAKRTKLSDDCLREAWEGNQNKLSGLTPEDFAELHAFTRETVGDAQSAFDAVRYLVAVHDIGKSDRVRAAIGAGPHVDHDEVFTMLISDPQHEAARRELLPTFDTLPQEGQELIRRGSLSRLNYPQTLQGEAPAASLEGIHQEQDPTVRDVEMLKAIVDIAGAAGHINPDKSVTMTSPTWRRMKNLNAVLRDSRFTSAEDRNNAFLDLEYRELAGERYVEAQAQEELDQQRTLARLECHLRTENPEKFSELMQALNAQPEPVKAILITELNRTGISDRATLPYYGPRTLQTLVKKEGLEFGLTYYGHILQEAHIADKAARAAGQTGIVLAELGNVVNALVSGELNPHETQVRFSEQDGVLVPQLLKPESSLVVTLPEFDVNNEQLRGSRVVIVGMGGGSDGVQAAAMRKVLKEKYGVEDGIVVSVRNERRVVENTGQVIGTAIKEVTAETRPVGNWRFLENIPLEGEDPAYTFILNSTDPHIVQNDLNELVAATDANYVIGLDTGGDSLYRTEHAGFSATSPTDTTPDQDRQVLEGLSALAEQNKDLRVLSMVVAPGVDSPPYAREVLDGAEATQIILNTDDVQRVKSQYAEWRMDGSGNQEGRYGKTPLAWLMALDGKTGVQALNLPTPNVTSSSNPWRAFANITPAMGTVVVMDIEKHLAATRPQ